VIGERQEGCVCLVPKASRDLSEISRQVVNHMSRERNRGGRRKGTPNSPRSAHSQRSFCRGLQHPSANATPAIVRRAKDIMGDFSMPFSDLATAYQRAKGPDGIPVWRDDKHHENVYALAHKAMSYWNWPSRRSHP
jgi:hypothetical protein